jgi:hypothetical protein
MAKIFKFNNIFDFNFFTIPYEMAWIRQHRIKLRGVIHDTVQNSFFILPLLFKMFKGFSLTDIYITASYLHYKSG